jgi:alkylation response protein AidB-like acyl-CoA dehydrogenase
MDLILSEQDRQFAERLRGWLAENVVPGWAEKCETYSDYIDQQIDWEQRLTSGGWAGVWWPEEFGGMGTTATQRALYAELTARSGAPEGIGRTGRRLLGPAVMRYGSPEQQRTILPRILSAQDVWCQGYSEPNAGSDLASVRTAARRDGDSYVVNGSKIWTSHAQFANRTFILVRTDPGAEKHAGLSMLTVDLRSPGVEIRPIYQITGRSEFCEVFFTDVVVPAENLLGREGQGWEVAKYILWYERGAVMVFDTLVRIERHLAKFAEVADGGETTLITLGRGAAELAASRLLAYRVLGEQIRGGDPTDVGSLTKLYWSQAWVRLAETALFSSGERVFFAPPGSAENVLLDTFLEARPATIASGSSEVQRNIIAKRILGLPTA